MNNEMQRCRDAMKLLLESRPLKEPMVGSEGVEKARQLGTLDLEKWFPLVYEMPMRRQEIQNQRNKIP